jgi:hypothetical protein
MRNILLGVFGTETFKHMKTKYDLVTFHTGNSEHTSFWLWEKHPDLIEVDNSDKFSINEIINGMYWADEIYFDITHIYPPINIIIYTLFELQYILDKEPERLLHKTKFFFNLIPVDTQKVRELFAYKQELNVLERRFILLGV